MFFVSKNHGNNECTHRISDAEEYLFNIYNDTPTRLKAFDIPDIPIDAALQTVYKQLLAMGRRQRTIQSYDYAFAIFIKVCEIKYVQDITKKELFKYLMYLSDIGNSPSTQLIRIKSIKAVLNRFFENGWYHRKFWQDVTVTVDKDVKPEAKTEDIALLINSIDKSTFTGFRNATAIILMYKTGIRSATLSKLKEKHIDFDDLSLKIDGEAMKNRRPIHLPIDRDTAILLNRLIAQNKEVRKRTKKRNDYVFITEKGRSMLSKSKNNAISKAISKYAKDLGLVNVNPHAIRRAFAKNLLRQGANIALISKALGHSSIEVTTVYLSYELDEVKDDLRNFL